MKILFDEWLPDQPDHIAPGLQNLSGVYPGANGYRPVGQFAASTLALPLPCKGAASFVSPSGTSSILAGTATSLYKQVSNGWQQIGTGYGIQGDGRWRFVQFGQLAIATDQSDAMAKVDLETGVLSALAGAPPKVQTLAVVQNFLVGGVVNGDFSAVAWSGENDAEYWTFGSRKSDYNIYPDGGAITGIVGGETGLILQRNAVRRMTYVGGNTLFRFDKIASNVGCATVHSVAQYGEIAFWYADDGFKMWDGSQIVPIGYQKVDATFAAQYPSATWIKISAAIDGTKSVVSWSMGDKIWVYNWRLERWSVFPLVAQILLSGFSKTLSVDEQDPLVGNPDNVLENVGLISFDDPRYKGGDPRFYVFDGTNVMGTLSGSNMAATFEMRNTEMTDSADTRVQRVRPMSDVVSGVTLTLNVKQRLGDAGVTTVYNTLNATGEMPVRARGRFVKPTFGVAAGASWKYIQGLDFKATRGARR